MKRPIVALLVLTAFLFPSCSTAPKQKTEALDKRNQAADYSRLGDEFLANGAWDNARKFYDEALKMNMSIDNVEGVSQAHNSLGRVYLRAGKSEDAEKSFKEALFWAIVGGNPSLRALSLLNLSETACARGDNEAALALVEEAGAFVAKDEKVLAVLLHNRGVIFNRQGRLDEAIVEILKAVPINQSLKTWTELGANYYVLASIYSKKGDSGNAVASAEKALVADKTAENSHGIASDLEALGILSRKAGKLPEAFTWFKRSFNVWLSMDDAAGVERSLRALVELAGEAGEDPAYYAALLARILPGAISPDTKTVTPP